MAPLRKKKNCSGRSQLRRRRVRFPIFSSFCFRQGLFFPGLLPLPVSGAETRARMMMKKNRSRKSQLRRFLAAAEETAVEFAECRRLIELHKKEDARSNRFIVLTLDIFDAKDQGDFTRAELLEHSRSELLAEMGEEIQAFMNAGGSLDF